MRWALISKTTMYPRSVHLLFFLNWCSLKIWNHTPYFWCYSYLVTLSRQSVTSIVDIVVYYLSTGCYNDIKQEVLLLQIMFHAVFRHDVILFMIQANDQNLLSWVNWFLLQNSYCARCIIWSYRCTGRIRHWMACRRRFTCLLLWHD